MDVGQIARGTKDELDRVKATVEANDQTTKLQLDQNGAELKREVDAAIVNITKAGQGLEAQLAAV